MSCGPPRLIVAGAGGDSGKTLVSLGLVRAWRDAGLSVAAFKKGPDFIDAAWLSVAAGRPAHNLDEWLMGADGVVQSFDRHARGADVCVIEGNRGLLDGFEGTSTARLAELLDAPVVLVVDVKKTTRTAAALVKGIQLLAPDVRLGGVVLNRVGGSRHQDAARTAIEEATGVRVVGAIPKLEGGTLLPGRHLGLVPPDEHEHWGQVSRCLAAVVRERVRLDAILGEAWRLSPEAIGASCAGAGGGTKPAGSASAASDVAAGDPAAVPRSSTVRVGVFRDAAFNFYYPENLEELSASGAELVEISPLRDRQLPECDLLYLGGGFPETHAKLISDNRELMSAVRSAVDRGVPVYAECGGLVYLARSLEYDGARYELCGVLDADIVVEEQLQGHGYAEMVVDRENPFFSVGTVLRGHEHHHSRLRAAPRACATVMKVRRGKGSGGGRGGLVTDNVLATWLHIHAAGMPDWASALMRRARSFAMARDENNLTMARSQTDRSQ